MSVLEAYTEVAELLASVEPAKILSLKASQAVTDRVTWLVQKKHAGILTSDEWIELERYLSLHLLVHLAKARVREM